MNEDNPKETELNIYKLLLKIKKYRQFFLDGDKSLLRLRSFLAGFDCGLASRYQLNYDREFLHNFTPWVAAQFKDANPLVGWCNILRGNSDSEEAAYELFFTLLEKYKKEYEQQKECQKSAKKRGQRGQGKRI
jgi:hypothetical protein